MVAIPDLIRLSGAEKDALILALLERLDVAERRIAELEAKLTDPPKTPWIFATRARSSAPTGSPAAAASRRSRWARPPEPDTSDVLGSIHDDFG